MLGAIAMYVVIVGSGVAGVTAARTIRENDPKANISIYTDENIICIILVRSCMRFYLEK